MDPLEIIGTMPELRGVVLESLYCEEYWHRGEIDSPVNVIHICAGGDWFRLCFDHGIVFWRESDGAPYPYEMPELDGEVKLVDLGGRFGVTGETVTDCQATAIEGGSRVRLEFGNGQEVTFQDIDDNTGYVG